MLSLVFSFVLVRLKVIVFVLFVFAALNVTLEFYLPPPRVPKLLIFIFLFCCCPKTFNLECTNFTVPKYVLFLIFPYYLLFFEPHSCTRKRCKGKLFINHVWFKRHFICYFDCVPQGHKTLEFPLNLRGTTFCVRAVQRFGVDSNFFNLVDTS